MPSDCFIFFDNPDGVFYSGTKVSGRIELTTTTSKLICGIVVHIKGTGNVCWEKEESHKEDGRDVTSFVEYTNNETYLTYEKYVLGSKYSDLFQLSPGNYNYTFEYDLPVNLPSSFTGKYGEIIYEITVEIDRSNHTYSNKFTQGFTVIYSHDLNLNPEYRLPKSISGEEQFSFCSCLCGRGNVEVEIIIPYNGFVAGQDIPFTIIISNDSTSDLDEGSKVELKREVTFESKTPENEFKHRDIVLDTKIIGGVLRFSKKEFKNLLEIPTTPPTSPKNLSCCIKIEYLIKVQIITACCADNIDLILPIIIGSHPLNTDGIDQVITSQPTAPRWEDTAVGSLRNLDLPPEYNTIGPPSYEDAKKLSEDFEMRQKMMHHQVEYIPRYPVFFRNRESAPPYTDDI